MSLHSMHSPPTAIRISLAVALFSLPCHRFAASLALPPSARSSKNGLVVNPKPKDSACGRPTTEVVKPDLDSNRVFVAGISPTSSEQTIRLAFSEFGSVQDVAIIGQDDDQTTRRKRAPYCFVTFDDAPSAQRALAAPGPTDSYQEIRPAVPMDTRRRSNRSRAQEEERLHRIRSFGEEANLILQVQSTHLDRLRPYLQRMSDLEGDARYCKVLGSTNANSKNVSLLFLSCGDPTEIARRLYADPLVARAINKSYIVQPGLLEGNLSTKEGCDDFAAMLYNKISREKDVGAVRMQVYPPKNQRPLLQSIGAVVKENDNARGLFRINPKYFRHILSVVEVYQYKGRGWERQSHDENSKYYMMGITPALPERDVVDINNILFDDNSGDEVSRAYFKLKEAIETYESLHGDISLDHLHGATALDCGSAPGGWTKYLIERFACRGVYSIDPGSLSPSVLELDEARHMPMKVQDALPILLDDKDAKGRVKILVSDMCLHRMEEQVDLLLLAKKEGLLAPNAFFVLTLKCIVGHSKVSYDAQVERGVAKLVTSADVEGVETMHLFSNRSGERTVMGYIH